MDGFTMRYKLTVLTVTQHHYELSKFTASHTTVWRVTINYSTSFTKSSKFKATATKRQRSGWLSRKRWIRNKVEGNGHDTLQAMIRACAWTDYGKSRIIPPESGPRMESGTSWQKSRISVHMAVTFYCAHMGG